MRTIAIAGLAVTFMLPTVRMAQAQWVVTDPPVEASTAQTAASNQQIAGYTNSLVSPAQKTQTNTSNTATNTQNIETTLTNVPQTAGDFPNDQGAAANDSIINPMPTVANVTTALGSSTFDSGSQSTQMGGGDSTLSSTATTLYQQNPQTNPGTDPVLDAQDGVLRVSSNIQGMAIDNLNQLQTRLAEINGLLNDLNAAKDITTVEAINARLSIAEVAVQAQEAQAANLAAIATAQSEINRENEAQAMRNEHLKTASLFSSYAQNVNSIPGVQ